MAIPGRRQQRGRGAPHAHRAGWAARVSASGATPFILSAFTMSTVSHGNYRPVATSGRPHLRLHRSSGTGWSWPGCSTRAASICCSSPTRWANSTCTVAAPMAALAHGVQTPVTDPLLVVSAMAAATERLGFGITVSTTYESPYLLARKFSTLDHLTDGRIGWNIVTSLLDSAARNIHRAGPADPARRALRTRRRSSSTSPTSCGRGPGRTMRFVRDRLHGVYTDPSKVHDIDHDGAYFNVPGAHLVEPSPQRTPVLFQAGTSTAGREFAARNAELVFASDPRPDVLRANVDDVRDARRARPPARLDQVPHLGRDRRRQHGFRRPGQGPRARGHSTTSRADWCCCRR